MSFEERELKILQILYMNHHLINDMVEKLARELVKVRVRNFFFSITLLKMPQKLFINLPNVKVVQNQANQILYLLAVSDSLIWEDRRQTLTFNIYILHS